MTQETELLVRFNSVFFFLIIIIYTCNILPQRYPDRVVDSLLTNGINNLAVENYSLANHFFTQLDYQYPELPLGKIYLAALKITEAYDYAEEFDENYILENLKKAESLSKKLINSNNQNIWNHYFLGLSTGNYAYFQALRKNWLSAFSNGLDAVKVFNKCISIDSSFYDSYTAIGSYKYWSSQKTKSLNWLPFFSDERKEGIQFLTKAVESAAYNYHLAGISLIWIYIEQNEPENAVNLANKLLTDFPGSRFFMWGLARAYEDIDKNKANEVYYDLLKSITAESRNNRYNEIVIKHKIAQNYVKLGYNKKALEICDELLSINNLNSAVKDKLKGRFIRIKTLHKELSE